MTNLFRHGLSLIQMCTIFQPINSTKSQAIRLVLNEVSRRTKMFLFETVFPLEPSLGCSVPMHQWTRDNKEQLKSTISRRRNFHQVCWMIKSNTTGLLEIEPHRKNKPYFGTMASIYRRHMVNYREPDY